MITLYQSYYKGYHQPKIKYFLYRVLKFIQGEYKLDLH